MEELQRVGTYGSPVGAADVAYCAHGAVEAVGNADWHIDLALRSSKRGIHCSIDVERLTADDFIAFKTSSNTADLSSSIVGGNWRSHREITESQKEECKKGDELARA